MVDEASRRSADRAASSRISRLSSAILRINQSLDVGTVLREVVESARELTGARLGVITTIDQHGDVQEFVTDGFSDETLQLMLEWPDGTRLFEHLRHLSEPLRIADFPAHLRSLGMTPHTWSSPTLQGTPMLHQGEHLGIFFLGDKQDGREFTSEDEEILVLFASQAAAAI